MEKSFDVDRIATDFDENERKDLRLRVSKKRLDVLKEWLDYQTLMADFLPKSKFGEAVNYCLNRWPALSRYAKTGFLPIDNGWSENELRPAVPARRYAVRWVGRCGKTAAMYMSIV